MWSPPSRNRPPADPHVLHRFLLRRNGGTRGGLAAIAPGKENKRVYFGNSGTEAIEAAIKLARYHTKREKFISFFGSFTAAPWARFH